MPKFECPRCKEETKCVDDMLMHSYYAEMYRCPKCKGNITVEYNNHTISRKTIKRFIYEPKEE